MVSALGKVLHEAGKFELECWPVPGKAWTEVRNAIQSCLRSPAANTHARETTTILLYLRGKIEQIEDGEAWIVLGDNVRLSRSWLRQLCRTATAQQIIVLDCPNQPGDNTLQEWIEELKLNVECGQCAIAASSPAQAPERFTQALLETLLASPQVGLSAASWIAQLQEKLQEDIPLHAWLSGTQGAIDILPQSISTGNLNPARSSAVLNLDAIQLAPVVLQTPQLSSAIHSIADNTPAWQPAERFPQQYSQLEDFLRGIVGSMAPALLKKIAKPNSHPQIWVDSLMQLLPPHHQSELKQLATLLLQPTVQPQTKSTHAPRVTAAISESFVRECEKTLANYIGPIASVLIKKILKSQSLVSPKELVEVLAAQIPDGQKAAEFRRQLLR